MARTSRKKSCNGIYHIMIRGINKQTIFEEDEDRLRFLETVRRFKNSSHIQLYSYCLMDNHVHLLVKETDESISKVIQRISASYVYWYNDKYDRCGHLFQERFKSEIVETISYFLTVLRYIHQNPLRAGLTSHVFESRWTSVNEYYCGNSSNFVDVEFALRLFSLDRNTAITLFTEYMKEVNEDHCLEDRVKIRLPDSEVIGYLKALGEHSSGLQHLERKNRDSIILQLKQLDGVTVRQLSRITGISKSVIDRVR